MGHKEPYYQTGFTIDIPSQTVKSLWKPETNDGKFNEYQHSLTISHDKKSIFISDLPVRVTKRIHKFSNFKGII